MAAGIVMNNFSLKQGHCLELKGLIPKDAKSFAINLGKDSSNYVLHFNPRFDHQGDNKKIICNSKEENCWGKEQRETAFPFQQGAETSICFEYQADHLKVKLSDGQEFTFPIRMPLDTITFLCMDGIELKSFSLH
ncbi:hypothetical protein XENTR_v10012525 [Xenopus tropicalis]|uniref:Galectin n=1 Tax=Xenopus tropicalis TaxID=8364 RepID=F6XH86_XENTR|nr:galectin-1 [Xenopus tropicalis]KAE8611617.1 hypothetical protein XENTR_v10012525 [Xenopus tropicalis]|eukprot:XP_002934260.1 PREDICTED: galectin-1-like [Xenopus tropicalis]